MKRPAVPNSHCRMREQSYADAACVSRRGDLKIANKNSSDCHTIALDNSEARAQKDEVRGKAKQGPKEDPVPNYEIVYLDGEGKLAFKFATTCDNEKGAKILAHAMKRREHKRF